MSIKKKFDQIDKEFEEKMEQELKKMNPLIDILVIVFLFQALMFMCGSMVGTKNVDKHGPCAGYDTKGAQVFAPGLVYGCKFGDWAKQKAE